MSEEFEVQQEKLRKDGEETDKIKEQIKDCFKRYEAVLKNQQKHAKEIDKEVDKHLQGISNSKQRMEEMIDCSIGVSRIVFKNIIDELSFENSRDAWDFLHIIEETLYIFKDIIQLKHKDRIIPQDNPCNDVCGFCGDITIVTKQYHKKFCSLRCQKKDINYMLNEEMIRTKADLYFNKKEAD